MAIHIAASRGDLAAVQAAISKGEDVNKRGWAKNGSTPLMWAARYGHEQTVRKLLSLGASPTLTDLSGRTALYYAAEYGHDGIVAALLSAGATVDQANKDGDTPLMGAAYNGHEQVVRKLLSSGASPALTDKDDKTALDRVGQGDLWLSYHTKTRIIKLLEEAMNDSGPVLPRNWTVLNDTKMKKSVYQSKTGAKETLSTPPGYPLHRTRDNPGVVFYDQPQEKQFTSTGGHTDFENGLEVLLQPNTVTPGSTVGIKVQPALAPADTFLLPEGIQSASPSYLISSEGSGLNGEVTLTMEHHIKVATEKEANELVFLQADSSPKTLGSKSVYQFQEVSKARSEFVTGGNKGKLKIKKLSKFVKIGIHKLKKLFADSNLYAVRVYRSPPQTTEDRMAVITISLCGRLYSKFHEILDKEIIPRDYPSVSREAADRTILDSISFADIYARLKIHPVKGWSIETDKDVITKNEVNKPETENFRPEDLHDYPPRIICRFFPEKNVPKRTTCTISLSGLTPEESCKVHLPLRASAPKPVITVDTSKLQEATKQLRSTALMIVPETQLSSIIESVFSLIERMATALRSSSLNDLADHTQSIKTDIVSVMQEAGKVAEECTRQTISKNIKANLAKLGPLSIQLNHVARVRLKFCQDDSEKTAALIDLVESGATILTTVDCLLMDIQTLSEMASHITIPLDHPILMTEIGQDHIPFLALDFDNVENYMDAFKLCASEQTDVRNLVPHGTQVAMIKCLKSWCKTNPGKATYGALIKILQDLGKGSVAAAVWKYLEENVVKK